VHLLVITQNSKETLSEISEGKDSTGKRVFFDPPPQMCANSLSDKQRKRHAKMDFFYFFPESSQVGKPHFVLLSKKTKIIMLSTD